MIESTTKTKECKTCKEIKPLKEFWKAKACKSGHQAHCKKCAALMHLGYKKDKERYKSYSKAHRDRPGSGYKKSHRKYRESPKGQFVPYVNGAKRRGLVFDFTLEEFTETFWGKPCYYCGEDIKLVGVDRVDNSKGYTKDNTVSCCTVCNFMKLEHTLENFIAKCRQIVEHQDKIKSNS